MNDSVLLRGVFSLQAAEMLRVCVFYLLPASGVCKDENLLDKTR